MGNRSHILLALTLAVSAPACFNFEEPELPEAGDAAILEAAIHVDENARLHFTGVLAPAMTIDGILRNVRNDTIAVLGLKAAPVERRRNGARSYDFRAQLAGEGLPLTLAAPSIEDVIAPPTDVQWPSLRRFTRDTIVIRRGEELVLASALSGTARPAPLQSSWTLDLVSQEGNFRLGGSGAPPALLRVPAHFLPAAANGRVAATLVYFQSGVYRPAPGDYLLTLTADVRVRWDIRVSGGP